MKVSDFVMGVGQHSDMAILVLQNAIKMKWQGPELGMYYHCVMHHLSAGATAEQAIIEANNILILTNVEE